MTTHTPLLVCLPGAGGDAHTFHAWQPLLPGLEIVTPSRPGKAARWQDAPLSTVEDMSQDVLEQLGGPSARPRIILGFSLGALVAFELTMRLTRAGDAPIGLIVAGSRAPDRPEVEPQIHELDDTRLREAVGRFSPEAHQALQDDGLAELLLPGLRADFAATAGYRHHPDQGDVIGVPILSIGGSKDQIIDSTECERWNRFTKEKFEYVSVNAAHDSLDQPDDEVAQAILRFADGIRASGDDNTAGPKHEASDASSPYAIVRSAWETTLGRTDFDDDTEFFAVGGSSILAAQVVAKVRKGTQVKVPLRKFLAAATVHGLVSYIAEAREGA